MGGRNQDRPQRGWLFGDFIVATGERNRHQSQRNAY
jgi:hypothetical protein